MFLLRLHLIERVNFHVFLKELLASKSAYGGGEPVREVIEHPVDRELLYGQGREIFPADGTQLLVAQDVLEETHLAETINNQVRTSQIIKNSDGETYLCPQTRVTGLT